MEIQRITGLPAATAAPSIPTSAGEAGFGDTFGQAVKSLDALQKEADAQSARLAAGESVEVHDVMLAYDRASLTMQLAVQVRNKLVEAYQDIMRMQV
jgi:flagellar hook-basal body complex protein FliE